MTVSENSVLETEVLVGGSAMPNERPGAMEPQSLTEMPEGFPRRSTVANGVRSRSSRRFFVVGGALLLSSFAIYEMGAVFSIGGSRLWNTWCCCFLRSTSVGLRWHFAVVLLVF
ncbi:glucosyltransferase [Shewanella putrefaciens]|nr:glucosyltransferase [Shewanella putrefaciens]